MLTLLFLGAVALLDVALPSTPSSASMTSQVPIDPGALFVYALVAVSVAAVIYFGAKRPKGPGGVGGGSI